MVALTPPQGLGEDQRDRGGLGGGHPHSFLCCGGPPPPPTSPPPPPPPLPLTSPQSTLKALITGSHSLSPAAQ